MAACRLVAKSSVIGHVAYAFFCLSRTWPAVPDVMILVGRQCCALLFLAPLHIPLSSHTL